MPISAVSGVGWWGEGSAEPLQNQSSQPKEGAKGWAWVSRPRGHSAFVAWGSALCAKSVGSPGFLRIGSEALGSKKPGGDVGRPFPEVALPLTVTSGLCSLVSAMLVNQPLPPHPHPGNFAHVSKS